MATVYLKDTPEFRLSAKAQKKSCEVLWMMMFKAWSHLDNLNGEKSMIKAALSEASIATVYLRDRPEFMLCAKAQKKSWEVLWMIMFKAWFHLENLNGEKSMMKAALSETNIATVYLRDRSESMLSATANKNCCQ